MKPITKVYAYKNKRTGQLVGKLFVKKPTSERHTWNDPKYELVECIVIEKISNSFQQQMNVLIDNYDKFLISDNPILDNYNSRGKIKVKTDKNLKKGEWYLK